MDYNDEYGWILDETYYKKLMSIGSGYRYTGYIEGVGYAFSSIDDDVRKMLISSNKGNSLRAATRGIDPLDPSDEGGFE